jgi:hypothetical protein
MKVRTFYFTAVFHETHVLYVCHGTLLIYFISIVKIIANFSASFIAMLVN